MSHKTLYDTPQWYAVRTHPKQEERADINLRAWNVETFSPKLKKRRGGGKAPGGPSYAVKSLFPSYIFARFEAGALLRKVCYTRGVHSVVAFGEGPAPIDDAVIGMIRAQEQPDGYVHIGEEFKPGDPVVIKSGPFKSLTAIFEREMSDTERVCVLLKAAQYQNRVLIERDQIGKAL
jgi:transcriptional antiterminator RfaH